LEVGPFGSSKCHSLILKVELVEDVEAVVECENPEVLRLDVENVQQVVDD